MKSNEQEIGPGPDCINLLGDTWVLWEHQKNNKLNYEQNTKELGSFNTIQDFWRYYNNYPYPSVIFSNGTSKPIVSNPDREIASISLFKKGVCPKWEDPKNSNGGEVAIRKFQNVKELDEMWELLSMLCIGEQFDLSDDITGIRVVDSSISKKALYRIELWFSDKANKDVIENSFKKLLKLGAFIQIYYKEHSTAVESTPKYNKYDNNGGRNNKRYNNKRY
jgi:translation initiation factor 4E